MIEFFMPMQPPKTTHQMKKWRCLNGKPVSYEPAQLKNAREKLTVHLGKHVPDKPMTGPIRMVVKWCFDYSGTFHMDGEPKITKPDVDNSVKLLLDCMTELGFWEDDCQVFSLVIEKYWARIPGIAIHVADLN